MHLTNLANRIEKCLNGILIIILLYETKLFVSIDETQPTDS